MEQFTGHLVTLLLGLILFGISRKIHHIIYRSLSDTLSQLEAGMEDVIPVARFARKRPSDSAGEDRRSEYI